MGSGLDYNTLRGGTPMETGKRWWIAMVVLAACARLLPHPWNFTPLLALGLFAGHQARHAGAAVLATLTVLALSDAVLGFDSGFWYVYGAAMISVALGRWTRRRDSVGANAAGALGSSMTFFLITNFMVWAAGRLYPHTLPGLASCFVAAIPFYQNQLLGDAFYTMALFGGYALLQSRIATGRQAT
jgi:hypothetical protein